MRSSEDSRPEKVRFLAIGHIVSPFGISGEVRVRPLTDFPERFTPQLAVRIGDDLEPYRVESVKGLRGDLLLKLEGCDATCSEKLVNKLIQVPVEQAVALPEEQYYVHEVVGLGVWSTDGRFLGRVSEVLRTGANDVYVVQGSFGEVLIPAIESVVKAIDLGQGRITVELMEGML